MRFRRKICLSSTFLLVCVYSLLVFYTNPPLHLTSKSSHYDTVTTPLINPARSTSTTIKNNVTLLKPDGYFLKTGFNNRILILQDCLNQARKILAEKGKSHKVFVEKFLLTSGHLGNINSQFNLEHFLETSEFLKNHYGRVGEVKNAEITKESCSIDWTRRPPLTDFIGYKPRIRDLTAKFMKFMGLERGKFVVFQYRSQDFMETNHGGVWCQDEFPSNDTLFCNGDFLHMRTFVTINMRKKQQHAVITARNPDDAINATSERRLPVVVLTNEIRDCVLEEMNRLRWIRPPCATNNCTVSEAKKLRALDVCRTLEEEKRHRSTMTTTKLMTTPMMTKAKTMTTLPEKLNLTEMEQLLVELCLATESQKSYFNFASTMYSLVKPLHHLGPAGFEFMKWDK